VACVFILIDPLNFIHVIESRCETYEIRVPNAKEMQIDKYAFPSFVLVFLYLWVKIHESVSSFSKSNPYRRKTTLVHLLPMF